MRIRVLSEYRKYITKSLLSYENGISCLKVCFGIKMVLDTTFLLRRSLSIEMVATADFVKSGKHIGTRPSLMGKMISSFLIINKKNICI